MLGTVLTLRRYPVKSMLGEELAECEVTPSGLPGDRGLALIHRGTGRVVSAKNPRLWRAMLTLTATGSPADAVKIIFPDGRIARSTDPGIDDVLSSFLDQPVTLTATPPEGAVMEHADPDEVNRDGVTADARTELIQVSAGAPTGTFFNFAPVHLITTATLARIGAMIRYRPNVVISTPGLEGFAENDWLGRDIAIGNTLRLRVIARTPRCAVPTLAHGDALPRDPDALRVVAKHNRVMPRETSAGPEPCAGVYARVLRPGRIGVGDAIMEA